MPTKIDFEFEKRAIELPRGEVLDIPERLPEQYEKIVKLEESKLSKSEFDFYKEMLSELFGKNGFKTIAPNGKNTNLDFLAKVYAISINLYMQDKNEIQNEEFDRRTEKLDEINQKFNNIKPLLNRVR